MVQPKGDWIRFKDDSEKLNYMKKCGLLSKTATAPKQLVYSGVFGEGFCTLLGYVDDFAAVVSINDQLHCIMPTLKRNAAGFGISTLTRTICCPRY